MERGREAGSLKWWEAVRKIIVEEGVFLRDRRQERKVSEDMSSKRAVGEKEKCYQGQNLSWKNFIFLRDR